MKKLIAVDLDGVLSDTLSAFIQFHNEVYKTALARNHFYSDYYWEVLNEEKEITIAKFQHFTKTHHFQNIQPVKGAIKAITFLAKHHQLIVITARGQELAEETNTWIRRHFPNKFKDIHVINHALFAKTGKTVSKGELCQKLNVDIVIEDNLHHAHDCVSDTTRVFLINQLWNKGALSKGISRVNSWKDLICQVSEAF